MPLSASASLEEHGGEWAGLGAHFLRSNPPHRPRPGGGPWRQRHRTGFPPSSSLHDALLFVCCRLMDNF